MMPTPMYRRGNYSSGDDFVLEYGELRFTFNERDFRERCEQAARKLGFLGSAVEEDEAEDLINLVVNGEVTDPASALGEHVNECWPELVGPSERSLVHWLRRLIFRGAWLDQRVKEGELDIAFNEDPRRSSTSSPTGAASRSSSLPSRAGTASPTCAASPATTAGTAAADVLLPRRRVVEQQTRDGDELVAAPAQLADDLWQRRHGLCGRRRRRA